MTQECHSELRVPISCSLGLVKLGQSGLLKDGVAYFMLSHPLVTKSEDTYCVPLSMSVS